MKLYIVCVILTNKIYLICMFIQHGYRSAQNKICNATCELINAASEEREIENIVENEIEMPHGDSASKSNKKVTFSAGTPNNFEEMITLIKKFDTSSSPVDLSQIQVRHTVYTIVSIY